MIEDLQQVLCDLGREFVAVRRLPPAMDHGRVATMPVQERTKILGVMAPMSSRQLETLPEGWRNSGASWFCTNKNLQTVDVTTGGLPDTIEDGAASWQVRRADEWSPIVGLNAYVVTRLDR